jgi:membrane-bound metal-dependent hydrolase YbcI (DUF457 family)
MFLGHYGVAFAAKRVAPRTSLGTLAFAVQFLDELWPILLLAGVENARIVPGYMAASQLEFVSYPYSHSLAMAAVWALLIGAIYFMVRRYKRGAVIVGLSVLSHWLLDAPMHAPDLELWPGSTIKVGLGLWNSIPITLLLDPGLFVIGLVIYLRATRALDRIGNWSLAIMVVLLAATYANLLFGPPPASERALAMSALGLWLFVPWSWWIDRHRVLRDASHA